jgi:branched-subunit amino acid ABC-type transport system permease component
MVWFTVIWVGLLVMFLTGLLAVLANRLIYHPMRRAALLSLMIAALGLSQVLENGVLNIPAWGSAFLTYPVTSPSNGFTVGPTHFTWCVPLGQSDPLGQSHARGLRRSNCRGPYGHQR